MPKSDQTGSASREPARSNNPEAIAKRAYELFLQRGSVPGHEIEDWLQAEVELTKGRGAVGDGVADGAGAGNRGQTRNTASAGQPAATSPGQPAATSAGADEPRRATPPAQNAGGRRNARQPTSH